MLLHSTRKRTPPKETYEPACSLKPQYSNVHSRKVQDSLTPVTKREYKREVGGTVAIRNITATPKYTTSLPQHTATYGALKKNTAHERENREKEIWTASKLQSPRGRTSMTRGSAPLKPTAAHSDCCHRHQISNFAAPGNRSTRKLNYGNTVTIGA